MFLSQVTGRKQQINLGGQRHKEEDRNRFLQRTEQERRARLLEKKRNSSATLIQVCLFLNPNSPPNNKVRRSRFIGRDVPSRSERRKSEMTGCKR